MRGSDWKYIKYLPDSEDLDAVTQARERFFSLPRLQMNQAEREIHHFDSGFYRGMSWALAKKGDEPMS